MSNAISGLLDRHHRRLLLAFGRGRWFALPGLGFWFGRGLRIRSPERKGECEARANPVVGVRVGVDQIDRAAMLLNDASNDREAEAGALLAGRDVGLEQALPVFFRPSLAVVRN